MVYGKVKCYLALPTDVTPEAEVTLSWTSILDFGATFAIWSRTANLYGSLLNQCTTRPECLIQAPWQHETYSNYPHATCRFPTNSMRTEAEDHVFLIHLQPLRDHHDI